MTSKLEKQFFDTFGIEPRDNFKGCKSGITFYTYGCNMPSCKGCSKEIREKEYPQITDRILLELICILSKSKAFYSNFYKIQDVNIEQLKEQVLTNCISKSIYFKHQVRKLFEEEK